MQVIEYPIFKAYPHVRALTTTRHGGFSQGSFASLNLSYHVGDLSDHVDKNRAQLHSMLGSTLLVETTQIHSADYFWLDQLPTSHDLSFNIGYGDALITQKKGIALGIKHADCQASLIFDPINQVIAAVHAGWKGQSLGIYHRVIKALIHSGSKPQDLLIAISPSLGPCCSEFITWKQDLGQQAQKYQVLSSDHPHDYIDLKLMALDSLQQLGLLQENIYIDSRCTKCGAKDFFSYRHQAQTGRCFSLIYLQHP